MKKILLLFACAGIWFSCSQDADLLSYEPQNQNSLLDEKDSDIELRAIAGSIDENTREFMAASNQQPLYEYGAYSGGRLVDFYYSNERTTDSFYDARTGRTYQYIKKFGAIGKRPIPCYGTTREIFRLVLVYYSQYNIYHVRVLSDLNPANDSYYIRPWNGEHKIAELGYVLNYLEDYYRNSNVVSGKWGYINCYWNNNAGCYRVVDYFNNTEPEWSQSSSINLGVVVR